MIYGRYDADSRINLGTQYSVARKVRNVRRAIRLGTLPIEDSFTLTGADRLDALAGSIYGDARYWWILAAASDIGWGLQVPPGTQINVIDIIKVQQLGDV